MPKVLSVGELRLDRAAVEVADAQIAVDAACRAHWQGGSLDAVNKAERRLADAHDRFREVSGGRVADYRR